MNNRLLDHGFNSGISKTKVRKMQHDLANLSAYIDIDERTLGSTGKVYDLFDNSNNHSCALLDTLKTTLTSSVTAGTTVLTGKVASSSGFKVGQEITIQDNINIERPIVTRADETVLTTFDYTTPATVINSAYDTSGNGGRKLVRLSNGWLVSSTLGGTQVNFYVSKDSGATWNPLCWWGHNATAGFSICSKNTIIYIISFNLGATASYCGKFDATTVTNSDVMSSVGYSTLDTQTSYGSGCSLAINSLGTELHACWSSKNATYPNSFNIRYTKGTINGDGSVSWGGVSQLTTGSTASEDSKTPSIVLDKNNYPKILYNYTLNNPNDIRSLNYNGVSWSTVIVYAGASYTQSNPSAIFVPQSINGLANGRIWVAWHGVDSVDSSYHNLRVSYSDDNGVTWSAMQKLTSGNTINQGVNASITANSNNEIFIIFHGVNTVYNIRRIKYSSGSWGSVTYLTTNTTSNAVNASTLYDTTLSFTEPLTIWQDVQSSSNKFYGKWTDNVLTPHLEVTALTNAYSSNALVYRSLGKITNNKLGFSDGVSNSVTYDKTTPVSVVGSAYTTSATARPQVLSNGNLIVAVVNASFYYVYKSTDNGNTWNLIHTSSYSDICSISIAIDNSDNICIYYTRTPGIGHFRKINKNGADVVSVTTVVNMQTYTPNGASIAINSLGVMTIAHSQKNVTYPNSNNIVSAKSVDGGVTWTKQDGTAGIDQVTTDNNSNYNSSNPYVLYDKNNKPIIITQWANQTLTYQIIAYYFNGTIFTAPNPLYNVATYSQSSPIATLQKYGTNAGRIWVTWHGMDSTDTTTGNIRISYSDDNGVTWSAMQKLTSGNTYGQYNPSITSDNLGNIYILFRSPSASSSGYDRIGQLIWNGISWSSKIDITTNTTATMMYPSTCDNYNTFTNPITIWQDNVNTRVSFYGKWVAGSFAPLLVEDLRYNITPVTLSETQMALWVQHEKDVGLTINSKFSMVGDASNENMVAMTNTNNVDIDVNTTENEFIYSSAYGHKITNRITMTRNSTALDKHITKILGAIGV